MIDDTSVKLQQLKLKHKRGKISEKYCIQKDNF